MGGTFNYKNGHCPEKGRWQCLIITLGTLLLVLLLAGTGSAATVTYNWSFASTNQSWVSNYTTTGGTVAMAFTVADGNPIGSLDSSLTGDNSAAYTATTTWTSPNFTWTNGTPVSARLVFDWKVVTYFKANAGSYYVILVKPNGSTSIIYPTAGFSNISAWSTKSNATVSAQDFVQQGNYRLKLIATLNTATNPNAAVDVRWDNPNITLGIETTPPSVTSNTNKVYVANNTLVSLNASITDTDMGVKNATVNVSQINSTINEAVLTLAGGYWINNSIIADKGDTNGFKNLTITAYDNASNRNNTINMTVAIDAIPPTKPTNFTQISAGSASINVNWSASTDPSNGSGVKYYQIERTNESFNYLTVPRTIMVNATSTNNIKATYENDSYWYAFKSNYPVNCAQCHGYSRPTNGNFFVKYNSSHLLVAMHTPDNDTDPTDDKISLDFDVNRNGGTAPQSDDKMYQISEGNNLTVYQGNGSRWVNISTNAISSVYGSGTHNPWYEIWIPLSEIGNPGNNSLINFMFESECTNGSDFVRRDAYFPTGADEDNPSTWMTVTFRNFTDYKFVQNASSSSYSLLTILNLTGSYRYNFTVKAIDNVSNIGNRSDPFPIFTSDASSYSILGYLLNTLNQRISGGQVSEDDYIVSTDSSGHYILTGLSNATYNLAGRATGYESNSTVSVTINGVDQTNVNITLLDDTPPSVISNTNNVIARNNTAPLLSAIITDLGTGVANATVNVSAINSNINEAILTNDGWFWTNNSITANKVTSGFVNLTITAYDNTGNVNHNVNMTVMIDPANGSTLIVDNTTATTYAGVNATYTLNLTNTGIYNDNFTITVSNPNNASYGAVGQNSSIPSIQKMKTHRLCSLLDFTSIFNSWNEFFILSTLDSHVNVPCIYCFFRNI
jgi:hypothetical protein